MNSSDHAQLLGHLHDEAISSSLKEPSFAIRLLVSNVNTLLEILKVPIRITLVTG